MPPLADAIDQRMYSVQVAAVTTLDELKAAGSLTEELKTKLDQIVQAAQDVINELRGHHTSEIKRG